MKLISNKFDEIECKIQHREFVTHTGILNKKRISAISTGIGTDNIDIVINELEALVNINFDNRLENNQKKSLNIIRLGTSGSIQKHIDIDTFITSSFGLGFDNLAHFYKNKRILNKNLSKSFVKHTNWPIKFGRPYSVHASFELLNKLSTSDNDLFK